MATYNRTILLPYLQDVCSMEMACMRISRDIQECNNRIKNINQQLQNCTVKPNKPTKDSGVYWLVMIICVTYLVWFVSTLFNVGVFLKILMVALVLIFVILPAIGDRVQAKQNYRIAVERYQNALYDYEHRQEKVHQFEQSLAGEKRKLQILNKQLTSAQTLRDRLYGVNIIPSRYRNVHVSYYLYDYFTSTRETDLDKIIQTMLLDEIIKRLDKIILQNEEIILNQRMQIAIQEKQNQMISRNHQQTMGQLARMERNQELQMDYQYMIAYNQEVTNFFLAANYWYKF